MPTSSLKLLAIDDNPDNLVTIEALITDALPECTILTALNGSQGLDLARQEDPDVILLDIVMPEMDGYTVCRKLKGDEKLWIIPVVFLTALRTDRESRIKALEAGAEAFLSKPVDEPELIAQIRAMAQIKEARLRQQHEKDHLAVVVAERTRELELELAERRLAEERLTVALKEKEVLIRELYHRTKNNMQVISSLLQLKKAQIQDETLALAFTEMENRIQSMALVHRKLYQSQDLMFLNLGEYLQDLVALVREGYLIATGRIEVVLETEDVKATIDTTIPCGLILNELISNAFNHAFPSAEKGRVHIWLKKNGDGIIELGVSDNGVGIGPEFDLEQNSRLGLQIIRILGENQLGGKVSFETDQGLTCRVRFPEAKERVWI
jgi:two-component sensor histidine kinase/AmiR/NasT family two-component response regulator